MGVHHRLAVSGRLRPSLAFDLTHWGAAPRQSEGFKVTTAVLATGVCAVAPERTRLEGPESVTHFPFMAGKRIADKVESLLARAPNEAAGADEVTAFLDQARSVRRSDKGTANGRLIFALDATMSRQPTWDLATELQSAMFDAAAAVGGLEIQLVYFRGRAETKASKWSREATQLAAMMRRIRCEGGLTQIGRVLGHAACEARAQRTAALVLVGDSMEEDFAAIVRRAGELRLLGVKAFCFHEGADPVAGEAFREIARITGGAYAPFDTGAAAELRALLGAAAAYAAGGLTALEARTDRVSRRLLGDLR